MRVAATGAASGAAAIAPGLGTLLALGAATSQALYALEQETELVMAIAIIYGHELLESDERVLEALVVVGIAGGSVKLRENVLVAGGERITVAAFRALPREWLGRAGGHVIARILTRIVGSRALSTIGRAVPLAIGMAVGAGFDERVILQNDAERYSDACRFRAKRCARRSTFECFPKIRPRIGEAALKHKRARVIDRTVRNAPHQSGFSSFV